MTYQIVAKLPNSLKLFENAKILAQLAVDGDQILGSSDDGQMGQPSWLEEYLDCVNSVNEEFKLEHERQVSAFDEIVGQMQHQPRQLKESTSDIEPVDTVKPSRKSTSLSIDVGEEMDDFEDAKTSISKAENNGSDESSTIVCASEANGSGSSVNNTHEPADDTITMDPIHFSKRKRVRYPSVIPPWLFNGARVVVCTNSVKNASGNVRFIGQTDFKPGIWIGVELDRRDGRNDGMLMGTRYFECDEDHGVFVRIDKIKPETDLK